LARAAGSAYPGTAPLCACGDPLATARCFRIPAAAPATHPFANAGFVTRAGSTLKLNGKPFRFGGTNNYYLFYKSPAMVDDVFADARTAGFDVPRTWAFGAVSRRYRPGSPTARSTTTSGRSAAATSSPCPV
jgi:hypothetical protein